MMQIVTELHSASVGFSSPQSLPATASLSPGEKYRSLHEHQ